MPFFRALEQRAGLSRSEYVILFCLAHRPGVTAQEIVVASGRPKNSISVSVAKLERKGLISRRQSAADSRNVELNLTESGRDVFARILPSLQERERLMTSVLSSTERRQFDAMLLKLGRAVSNWENVGLPDSLARDDL